MRWAALSIAACACGSAPAGAPEGGLALAVALGDFPKLTSVVVEQHGAIVSERYFGGAGAETLHDTRSATKSITALAVGAAIGDGALPGPGAPAFAYLADLRPFAHDDARKQAITIADLLSMSSALDCDDNDDASPGNENLMHPQPAWTRWAVDLPTRAPSGFHYCTTGAFLLGQIVQRATGTPIDRYISQRLLAPLGVTRFTFARSPSGEVMTGGGLRLTSRALAALGRLVLDHGRHAGAQLVPADFVAAATTVHARPNAEQGYGYLFWRRDWASPCGAHAGWYMAGNGGNAIIALPDLDAVVVVTSRNYNTRGMHQQTIRLVEQYVTPSLCP